jgi:hypothetical protein
MDAVPIFFLNSILTTPLPFISSELCALCDEKHSSVDETQPHLSSSVQDAVHKYIIFSLKQISEVFFFAAICIIMSCYFFLSKYMHGCLKCY